jgi:hypothetical protein
LLTRLINTYTKWAKYDAIYQTNKYNSDRSDSEKSDDYDSDRYASEESDIEKACEDDACRCLCGRVRRIWSAHYNSDAAKCAYTTLILIALWARRTYSSLAMQNEMYMCGQMERSAENG